MRMQLHSWLNRQFDPDSVVTRTVSLLAVVASVAVSLVGYSVLPEEIQIRWTLGTGVYYGPEFAPTAAVMAVFPLLVGVTALGGRWLVTHPELREEPAAVRRLVALVAAGSVLLLLVVQAVLVVANL